MGYDARRHEAGREKRAAQEWLGQVTHRNGPSGWAGASEEKGRAAGREMGRRKDSAYEEIRKIKDLRISEIGLNQNKLKEI